MLLRVTEKCEEMCSHCMIDANPRGTAIDLETFREVYDFLQRTKPKVLLISGGEPTTHPNIVGICMILKRSNPDSLVSMLSNGSFIFDDYKVASVKTIMNAGVSVCVRTHQEFYPSYKKVLSKKHDFYAMGCEFFDGGIDALSRLGRAKDSHPDFKTKGAQCANTVLAAKQSPNERVWLDMLEYGAKNYCKPSIGVDGTIYAGETQWCAPLGHVRDATLESIYERAKKFNPKSCNKCRGLEKIKDLNRAAYDLLVR